jgi:hypothetical protein
MKKEMMMDIMKVCNEPGGKAGTGRGRLLFMAYKKFHTMCVM